MTQVSIDGDLAQTATRPRVGFLGVGWIGHHRMRAIAETGQVEVAAVADPSAAMIARAAQLAPNSKALSMLDELFDGDVDGIVIATPTALHAEQSIRALARGKAVFCQKPLGRTAAEVRAVIDAARSANRLLAVDLSYRFTEAMDQIRQLVHNGELGHVYAVELTFHNAYGPDKPWFYEPALAGGGCVIDLGVHLVDLALWVLDFPKVVQTSSRLFADGQLLSAPADRAEDYALATLDLETGTAVHLTCSWRLPAGRDAVISAAFYGTQGGAAMRNINGSFYDFVAELYRGTACECLAAPPDAWFGRAAADWAQRLAAGQHFDPSVERCIDVAAVLDRIYGR
ncbi:Gfo/Idh/MocA family oxidoreductase [Bradyrhizobium sp. ISRA442]|uniref:Gfo/Idh/MocA family protein n=1 Tax=Bradyrhizobium sp. ISRA442 TaxID=2866197 RepID=UPI00311B20AF